MNYYINKNQLDNDLINASKTLTKILKRMVHISVDYSSLCAIVRPMTEINPIRRMLAAISETLGDDLVNRLTNE